MKKVLIIVGGLVLLALIVVVLLLSNIGSIIKHAVESFGSDATKAPVKLETVDLSLSSGQGSLKGLSIGNPDGFKAPKAFELGAISVQLDPSTVTSDVVVIKEIVIESPRVTFELGLGGSNLGTIQDNVTAYGNSLGAGGDGGEKHKGKGDGSGGGKKKDDAGGKKFVIENLWIRSGCVEAAITPLGGKGVSCNMSEIHLTNIGRDSGGATAAQVTTRILEALTTGALSAASSLSTDALKGAGGGVLDKAKGALKGVFGK
jgi:hypothetical protein